MLAINQVARSGHDVPLDRQREGDWHDGGELSRSTLADQGGAWAAASRPLYLLIEAHVLAAKRLHGHDTTVPVLAKRSEEHTSELQSLMRISYAVFCLKKKKKPNKR